LQDYIEALRQALPPVFAGPNIGELTGGLFSWGSIKNLRAQGKIPETCFGPRSGKSNAPTPLLRDPFLAWLEERVEARRSTPETKPPRRGRAAMEPPPSRRRGAAKLPRLPREAV